MQRIDPRALVQVVVAALACAALGALTWTVLWAAGLLVAIVASFAALARLTWDMAAEQRAG
jgi:hypothetical protein